MALPSMIFKNTSTRGEMMLNTYMADSERGMCTTCSSYVLCLPQCETLDGEWGACGFHKEIKQWNDTCSRWWNVDESKGERP